MTHLKALSQWQTMVSTKLPTLSGPQSTIVALWSFALVVTGWSGLTTVSALLAWLADQSFATVRERLRDWYRDADDKSGTQRREVVVATCFAPLLRWVVSLLPPTCTRLALAMDASTLGQRFTVLSISVVIRGSAIPVAWTVVRATQAGAWQPHWGALFAHLRGAVPPAWQVIVTADRGLYAKWLYAAIVGCGWHPFLRINRQGKYRRVGESTFRPLSQVVVQGGRGWAGRVTCFATKARQLDCTLLARWDHGHTDPWLIVTDLPAAQADVAWYGMRSWIEGGYKDVKRGGWHWEQTKMEDPARAERVWLVMAVATLWVVSVGCQAEASAPRHAQTTCQPPTSPTARVRARPSHGHSVVFGADGLSSWRPCSWGNPCPQRP